MYVSLGSIITCFLTMAALTAHVCFAIYVRKDVSYGGVKFTFLVMLLILIRMMIPCGFPFTVTVVSYKVLPPLSRVLFRYIGNFRFGLAELLLGIWITGTVVKLSRFIYKGWKHQRLLALYLVSDLSQYPEIEEVLRTYEAGKLRACVVPMSLSPCVVNPIHPTLVLPESILEEEDLDLICRHEIEHFRNYDLWLKLLLELVLCTQWFNPVAYIFHSKLSLVYELLNDEKVIAGSSEEERLDYMDCLLRMARRQTETGEAPEGLSFLSLRQSDLSVRIHYLLGKIERKHRKHRILSCLRYAFVISMLICSLVFVPEAYRTVEADEEEAMCLNSENAYFVSTGEGFVLYVDGEYWVTLAHIPEELTDLSILKEEDVQ